MKKKLTATIRATYEGYKSAGKNKTHAQKDIDTQHALETKNHYKVTTPDDYIKLITLEQKITLGEFLEKIITLSSTRGLVSFMQLYQYMYEKNLLGKEIEELTGQEIINYIFGCNSYWLKPKNKQVFLSTLIQLSGLSFHLEDKELTKKIQGLRGREKEIAFTQFTLMEIKGHTTLSDGQTITSLRGVSIMKDFINVCFNQLSRLFIPLEDILKITNDYNGDHTRGFNLILALRHAELGKKKNFVEWDLEQCLNVGQWKTEKRKKTLAWQQITEALEAGAAQGLINFKFIYKPNKPQNPRYIDKVVIYRRWETGFDNLNINFNPENIKPTKKTSSSYWL